MGITVVGLLEADLPNAIEYREGGLGPFFGSTRTEEAVPLFDLLQRSLKALASLKITDAVTCYVDDVELFRDADNDERSDFEIILEAARDATGGGDGISFHLMLAHEGGRLSHIITLEASIDHPADEAAISILDIARVEDEPVERKGAQDSDEALGLSSSPLSPVDDDVTFFDERAADVEDEVEEFLNGMLKAFEKGLAVHSAEIDVWTDWEGEFAAEAPMGALPGITG